MKNGQDRQKQTSFVILIKTHTKQHFIQGKSRGFVAPHWVANQLWMKHQSVISASVWFKYLDDDVVANFGNNLLITCGTAMVKNINYFLLKPFFCFDWRWIIWYSYNEQSTLYLRRANFGISYAKKCFQRRFTQNTSYRRLFDSRVFYIVLICVIQMTQKSL